MSNKIEIVGVSKVFKKNGQKIYVLQETDLIIEKGRFISIIGPSGCGKSTLFNIIAGLIKPSTGQVIVDGKDIVGKSGYVGYMLQKDMLLPWRTILQNIILGMEIRGIPHKTAVERAIPLMERYGLKGFEHHYPKELSGGMRQRAALLRTILYDRDIILLDEPFGALDAQTRLLMQNWLLEIWADFHKTILFVTHDIDEAIYLSDEIYVFTARPAKIKAKITVHMDRPRKQHDMLSPEFVELKRHLLNLLQEEVQVSSKQELIS
ncbi:ABC transporter ATP-binding protein [Anoxybacillus geothermalis]|nr:Aliphatic sulfonates import ATP-binding protein SsuB [Geobacillus sp. 12AMOR1]MED4923978.1 ABC transporter ATP-binding protein [Anoxybacillus geothermalis]